MLRILIIVSLLIIVVLGASIGFFNATSVRFNFLFGSVELPLIALLVLDFLFAALLTMLVLYIRMFGLRSEIRRLKKQVQNAETELKSLRNLAMPAEAPAAARTPDALTTTPR
jgi:putative membrane protein